jgi:uncharacterized protein YbaR (Trm112 family)
MHIGLTDVLTCPRCGPAFGLILRADRAENRHVLEGVLGCANCREQYVVYGGLGRLRAPFDDVAAADVAAPAEIGDAEAVRIAALAGITEGPAILLIAGPAARFAPAVAALVDGIEVVAAGAGLGAWRESPGVSRIDVGARLPFHDGRLRAVHLSGEAADILLEEALRAVAPFGRVVLEPPAGAAIERLARGGFRPLAQDARTLVAGRADPR